MERLSTVDMAATDLSGFMRRHDRRSRLVFLTLTLASLLISTAAIAYGVGRFGSVGAIPGKLWFPVLFFPLPIMALWISSELMARQRKPQPDGSLPMNPDDARSTRRVANAGAVFVAGASLVCIVGQAGAVLRIYKVLPPGDWIGRLIIVAIGALMMYFGNAWPRIPTARGPGQKPAAISRLNRIYGRMVVLHGLLFVLAGLLLPFPWAMSAGAVLISLSTLVFAIVWVVMYYRAAKTPSTA